MLTKQEITIIKKSGSSAIANLIKQSKDTTEISHILENLGHLPAGFDGFFLYKLLSHKIAKIRAAAVRNIAKLGEHFDTPPLLAALRKESNWRVRRDIVSAIGRQRNTAYKPILYDILADEDPKIVCEAIRGLLVFQRDEEQEQYLRPLVNHPNEMVRAAIYKAFFAEEKSSPDAMPHAESPDFLKNLVVNADVLDALQYVPNDSIHLTFTSPPYYNARDYSIYPSYEAYLQFLEQVFKETQRVTKEGRFLIVNTSPIIIPRLSRSHSSRRYGIPFDLHAYLVKNGWEFIDDIIWLKPEASVKNRVGGFGQHRKPLGYKPNAVTEYLMVYRKQTEKLLDWNIRSYPQEIAEGSKVADGYETSNIWRIDPCFDKIHPAIFPAELCKRVIQYYSYKGDLIFDPFGGSGTVGKMAERLGRHFFLTEKEAKYVEYMKKLMPTTTNFLTLSDFETKI
jgi:DNA modification methylase